MLEVDIKACPVFTRWQVQCNQCGVIFYVDAEPEATKENLISLENIQCEWHPREQQVLELA